MEKLELIAPPKSVSMSFAVEPAYNVVTSLLLLCYAENTSGLDDWIYGAYEELSPEQRQTNSLVFAALGAPDYLGTTSWPSFTAWVDNLAARDPIAMRDRYFAALATTAESMGMAEIPSADELLADRGQFVAIVDKIAGCTEACCDTSTVEQAHGLLAEPARVQATIVDHLRSMWDDVVAEEWQRQLPFLQQSVQAFEKQGLEGLSPSEALHAISRRDMSDGCMDWASDAGEIVFVPSPHVGPYVVKHGVGLTKAWVAFAARIPEGPSLSSPPLSRSEILMRLSALADDTRLRILHLVAQEGELTSAEIMERLDLSQSATSRHVRQLAATGFLSGRKQEGVKHYRLNRTNLGSTTDVLEDFIG